MNKTADYLFEIGTEELPAKQLLPLATALQAGIQKQLAEQALPYETIQAFATPRRLAIQITALDCLQADSLVEKRGPALDKAFDASGQPTKACLGFAKSCNTTVDKLETLTTEKGQWVYFKQTQAGLETRVRLPELIRTVLKQLPIKRPMRWADSATEFLRPVHWVVLMQNDAVIACEILGKQTSNITFGHRFLAPDAIKIQSPSEYPKQLEAAYVCANWQTRRHTIQTQLETLATSKQGQAHIDATLLDEVTGLVEWPTTLCCRFDNHFLAVPNEALVAAMQSHQKSFPIYKEEQLQPYFLTVSNIVSRDAERVIAGNERVMHARLSDAAFFYQADLNTPLANHIDTTRKVIYQKQLGTLYDKSQRVSALCQFIAEQLGCDLTDAKRAAALSKCDLMTDMVGEFPELQGIMGKYYAKHDGESESVANALQEQYLPRFAGDALPASSLGSCLALSERIDTLVGIFAIGQKPTGVKDPFKLRRQALGVIRLIIEGEYNLDLNACLHTSLNTYSDFADTQITNALQQFIIERLRAYYQDRDIKHDVLSAVLERQQSHLLDINRRVIAVSHFQNLNEAKALAKANKRVSKLLQKANGQVDKQQIDKSLLTDSAELKLATLIEAYRHKTEQLYHAHEYTALLSQLANLREPIDTFFDEVMVNVEDEALRSNRLALLASLRHLFLQVADISLLQS